MRPPLEISFFEGDMDPNGETCRVTPPHCDRPQLAGRRLILVPTAAGAGAPATELRALSRVTFPPDAQGEPATESHPQ